MTNDEEHTIYTNGFNAGKEHSRSSRETLKLFVELEERLNAKIDTKVSFSTFTWVLGLLMTVVVGSLAIIYSKVESVNEKVSNTQNSVSRIEGVLSISDIE